jgi:hypothetical protein
MGCSAELSDHTPALKWELSVVQQSCASPHRAAAVPTLPTRPTSCLAQRLVPHLPLHVGLQVVPQRHDQLVQPAHTAAARTRRQQQRSTTAQLETSFLVHIVAWQPHTADFHAVVMCWHVRARLQLTWPHPSTASCTARSLTASHSQAACWCTLPSRCLSTGII